MANSVYIAIEADTKHFQAALEEIKKQSGIVGGVAAQNFQSSFGSSIRNLSKDFSTAFNSLKMAKIDLPTDSIKSFANYHPIINPMRLTINKMVTRTVFTIRKISVFLDILDSLLYSLVGGLRPLSETYQPLTIAIIKVARVMAVWIITKSSIRRSLLSLLGLFGTAAFPFFFAVYVFLEQMGGIL
jgi:hypothetical protein